MSDQMRRGFTLIEMLLVISLIGIMIAIAIPVMRVSPERRVRMVAHQLARNLDVARTRALATRKQVRLAFDLSGNSYVGYLDDDRDGTFAENQAEVVAFRSFATVGLPGNVQFGQGTPGPMPGDPVGATTLTGDQVDFDERGITKPFGTRGTIYFVHRDFVDAVAAVGVSASGSFKVWVYRGGEWQ